MFDFAWSEIALIGVVALVLIGPKDMPVAIRAVSGTIRKLRRMAGEFQHHVDDMLREADMQEVRSSIQELRTLDLRGQLRRAIDPDRSLTRALDDPFAGSRVVPGGPLAPPAFTSPVMTPLGTARGQVPYTVAEASAAPDFVPPEVARRIERDAAPLPEAPDFIPPGSAAGAAPTVALNRHG